MEPGELLTRVKQMLYYYYDWTYILVVIGAVICIAASARVKNVFSRYSRIQSHSGLTGQEAGRADPASEWDL